MNEDAGCCGSGIAGKVWHFLAVGRRETESRPLGGGKPAPRQGFDGPAAVAVQCA
ncbi:hypothetical protein ISE1_0525 [plant metagenome]|uniref:Uncharacterized protein n=1 Tax=plant metagenome TaxID=1297885 RepID=A0A484SZ38_9ZZZZ